jgi:hypothetical protein
MINDYKVLTCDSCGTERVVKETEANRARLQAAREGWKSFTYTNLHLKNSVTVTRLWDLCPTCEFPDHETVNARVQDEDDRGERKKSRRL